MVKFLGNSNHLIDWDKFIEELLSINPLSGYQFNDEKDPNVIEVATSWREAGYNLENNDFNSAIAWEAWYSGIHFNNDIPDKLCAYLKLKPIDVSMVTRIVPGRFAPWHWDIRNKETLDRFRSYNKPITRIHIHMSPPSPGHIFIVGNHCFYNEPQGSIYKWNDWKDYHAGGNCGLVDKYQFSIIGVPNN